MQQNEFTIPPVTEPRKREEPEGSVVAHCRHVSVAAHCRHVRVVANSNMLVLLLIADIRRIPTLWYGIRVF